ncbi:universal stress protein [Streptomyces sp. NPDC059454]|uniref:universal stress protein n=1 Tax=Streptomyces sp. NPDC059454 TaxID=3346836 RepID=UPI0036A8999D
MSSSADAPCTGWTSPLERLIAPPPGAPRPAGRGLPEPFRPDGTGRSAGRRVPSAPPPAAAPDRPAPCRLVVIGRRRRAGRVGPPVGPVAHVLLHHSHCPVVLVPTT